jgi:mycofactocin system glycosyltransferase
LVLDGSVRRIDGGRVIVGGSPIRIVRLTPAGAALVDRWCAGEPVGSGLGASRLARRLLDGGLAHPRPDGPGPLSTADVTVVVPCRDGAADLGATLAAVAATVPAAPARVVVADDGSTDPTAVRAVAQAHGAEVVRLATSGGPAAARNAGLAAVATSLVALVDCDVEPDPDWLAELLPHLADPAVAAVAPRVRAGSGDDGPVARFERVRSPIDLGPTEGRVAPRTRVAYVPTTCLVARTAALRGLGGFDEDLRFGEDVDLVWRLVDAGRTVRYEPRAGAVHPPRSGAWSWLRQRFDYGTAAAPLAHRHPGAVAPVAVSAWTAGAWALAAGGHPAAGIALTAAATAGLPSRLQGLEQPGRESLRLVGTGTLRAWRPLATAVTRTWWPVAVGASLVSRRARRVAALAAVAPALADWVASDRAVDPVRFVGLHLADHLAYGAGVWSGCRRLGDWSALAPDLTSWPGRQPAIHDDRISPST